MSVVLTTQLVSIGLMAAAPAGHAAPSAPAAEQSTPATGQPALPDGTAPPATANGPANAPDAGEAPLPADPAPVAGDPAASPATASPVVGAPVVGERDPLEKINRFNYAISQPVDRYLIRPVAMTYKTVLPEPLRDGVRNAISNLYEPVVLVNDILQLRPGRAIRTVVRVVINLTIGVAGLFDMAKRKPFHLPHHNNGFADTLGVYGVKAGPYLYLPILGPTTLRDGVGAAGDYFTQPRVLGFIIHPNAHTSIFRERVKLGTTGTVLGIVSGIDTRAQADPELQALKHSSIDPYAALRSSYLQNRLGEIAALKARHGQPAQAPAAFDDPLTDPAAPAPKP